MKMLRYELKKICMGTGGKVSLLLILAALLITTYAALNMSYTKIVDGDKTETIHSLKAGRILKELSEPWEGVLDEAKLAEILAENRRINKLYDEADKDIDPDLGYAMRQGFEDIRDLMNRAYGKGLRDYDYYIANYVEPERASEFYPNRIRLLKEWLKQDTKGEFSEADKEYIISQFENLKTPFYYERFLAWSQLFVFFPVFLMISVLIMGYPISRLFAGEFSWKADAIFFSTACGRNKAVSAKIKAGIVYSTIVYVVAAVFMTSAILLAYGPSGWNCPIQITFGNWKSIYNITIGQEYILMLVLGYVAYLFINVMVMLVAAKTNSVVVGTMIPIAILFIPSFVPYNKFKIVDEIMALWPDQLLNADMLLSIYKLFNIGGKIIPSAPVLGVSYGVLALAIPAAVYFVFCRKQAG